MEGKKFNIHPPKKFEIEGIEPRNESLSDNTPISEIEPIEEGGVEIQNREDLSLLVEPPVLDACQILFDKGIKTVFSSANKKDIHSGYAHIAIDFDSLSEENKEVAKQIGEEGLIHGSIPKIGIYLKIPIEQHSTLGEVKKKSLDLVNKFENQSI